MKHLCFHTCNIAIAHLVFAEDRSLLNIVLYMTYGAINCSRRNMPSQFHVTGCSHSPHGYILCCFVLGPGFSSMSPDRVSMSISIEWILLALTGKQGST